LRSLLMSLLVPSISVLTFSCTTLPAPAPSDSPTAHQSSAAPATTSDEPTTPKYDNLWDADPSKVDNSNLPITPTEYLGITGSPPQVDIATYTLTVDGLVNSPLVLSYDMILKYPTVSEVLLLICPGFFADNAEWTGIPMTTLLAEAGVKPEATTVVVHAMDGFSQSFTQDDVEREGVFLAHAVNGEVLPKEHGFPLRLVVKGKYGSLWVKWVDHIEVK
jgi:DMSO/TMAO reductase YedYZ molybdopterin-dependent catalytic subunit